MDDCNAIAEITIQDDVVILKLLHEELISTADIQKLEETLGPLIQLEKKINYIIDFSRVNILSSSALGFLLRTHKKLTSQGGRLVLCCLKHKFASSPNDTYVYELLKVVELDGYFEITETLKEALERIHAPLPPS